MWLVVFAILAVNSRTLVSGWLFWYSEKCYDHIGCFSNRPPFNRAGMRVPQSPDHIQIQFYLFTRHNQEIPILIDPYSPDSIMQSTFDGTKPSIFVIHGYSDSGAPSSSSWQRRMTQEFLTKDDLNVIVVDWEKGADSMIYQQSAANTRVVGATIAQLLRTLVSNGPTSYDMFTLVGHSLGSHIAGYAGAYVNGTIARIFGLDPAGLSFENSEPEARLNPTDAKYVEAIHTDQESLTALGFGLEKAIGHADFYPNGGQNQPGCERNSRTQLLQLIQGRIGDLSNTIACSHMRVLDLFTESINSNCVFTGTSCSSLTDYESGQCLECDNGCADMGYNGRVRGQGRYYFDTNTSPPYCYTEK